MHTLQIRNVPEDIYNQIKELAELEERSLAKQTLILIKEALKNRPGHLKRRKEILEKLKQLSVEETKFDPIDSMREDRNR